MVKCKRISTNIVTNDVDKVNDKYSCFIFATPQVNTYMIL